MWPTETNACIVTGGTHKLFVTPAKHQWLGTLKSDTTQIEPGHHKDS